MSREYLTPIKLPTDPGAALEATPKQYVDRSGQFLTAVRAATTTNITNLNSVSTIDSVSLGNGDRVLVKDQTTGSQNGIYTFDAGTLSRSSDADTAAEIPKGIMVRCTNGGTNFGKVYTLTNTVTTVGTDNQNWKLVVQVDAGGSLQYPSPLGTGHMYFDFSNRCLSVYDPSAVTWVRSGHPYICTSTTRPGFVDDNMVIWETDTQKLMVYYGGTWYPAVPDGGTPVTLSPIRQVFTASGTWTKPANLVYAEVEVQGGGGGGSGTANSAASTANAGGSGGGGGYTKKIWLNADLSATETVTVGAGGTAGPASDAGGGAGGNSSFKTQIGNGGGGGSATGASSLARGNGGLGGGGSGGDFTVAGSDGPTGAVLANAGGTASQVQAVQGGAAFLAGSGRPGGSAASGAGATGQLYGGGGVGGYNRAASGAQAGGAGAPGVVIITSYVATSTTVPATNPSVYGKISKTGNQSVASGASVVQCTFGAADELVGGVTFDDANDNITVPIAGLYLITFHAVFENTVTGLGRTAHIRRGTTVTVGSQQSSAPTTSLGAALGLMVTAVDRAVAGSQYNFYVGQNSGSAINVGTSLGGTYASVLYLGP